MQTLEDDFANKFFRTVGKAANCAAITNVCERVSNESGDHAAKIKVFNGVGLPYYIGQQCAKILPPGMKTNVAKSIWASGKGFQRAVFLLLFCYFLHLVLFISYLCYMW